MKYALMIFRIYFLFLILIAVLPINNASSNTLTNVFVVNIRLDYLLHSILFIPWAFMYLVAFRPARLSGRWIAVGTGLLMASATEGVQYFLTYRGYNINDLISNFFGVFLGTTVLFMKFPYNPEAFPEKLTDRQ
jgi:VanZ family protein